jgi:single-strand DNA-binding protein
MADTQVTIVGNLAADPEVRSTPSGATVASFRVAVTPRVREGDQWRDGETSFFRCTAWRSLADNLAESVGKGARVIVVGRLRQRSWETPRARSARSPRSRPMRSASASSSPRRSPARRGGSTPPPGVTSSPTSRRARPRTTAAPGTGARGLLPWCGQPAHPTRAGQPAPGPTRRTRGSGSRPPRTRSYWWP